MNAELAHLDYPVNTPALYLWLLTIRSYLVAETIRKVFTQSCTRPL